MMRSAEIKANLHKINQEEMALVAERTKSDEHREAIARFQAKKEAKAAEKAKSKL